MAKKCKIEYCDDCKYYYNEYYSYDELCEKLNRKIEPQNVATPNGEIIYRAVIPKDCPLDDWSDDE